MKPTTDPELVPVRNGEGAIPAGIAVRESSGEAVLFCAIPATQKESVARRLLNAVLRRAARSVAFLSWRYNWDLVYRAFRLLPEPTQRHLVWRLAADSQVTRMTFHRDAATWTVAVPCCLGQELFIAGNFHGHEIEALVGWLRRFDLPSQEKNIFVDIGANIGTTCIPFVQATGCRGVAIEPVSENFAMLVKNLEANAVSNRIVAVRKAVMNAAGPVRMNLVIANSGGDFVHRSAMEPELNGDLNGYVRGYQVVESDTLPAILAGAGAEPDRVALVWCDVQGCEPEIIASGAELWRRGVPLWAEVEPFSLRLQGLLDQFEPVAAKHFDRFICESDLLAFGAQATPRPISTLRALIDELRVVGPNTNILLLPPAFPSLPS